MQRRQQRQEMPQSLDAADPPGVNRLGFGSFVRALCHASIVRQPITSRKRNILLLY
jgi:hypothetical protein